MENLLDINLLYNHDENINIKLIFFNINREGKYPFIQILLNNYNCHIPFIGLLEQKLIFPQILFNNNMSIETIIKDYLKDDIGKNEDLDKININGFLKYENEIFIYIDTSFLKIDNLYLTKTSNNWFAMLTEIINLKHICNIPIANEVTNYFINNIEYVSKIDKILYPLPEVIYEGSSFKKVLFQNIFGVSKIEGLYGYFYYFTYNINIALQNGNYSKDKKQEIKNGKEISDINGKYFEGGINRIAILSDKIKYLTNDEVRNIINKEEWNNLLLNIDTIVILNNNETTILIQDFKRQIPLSYHKINKKTIDIV